ncbi:MAG: phosphomannomutase/phosphoglucomutase [Alphaproteobacteria bacterium]|nr:phosphomannomutase/phosphoglucomutase [Alphaproteobacteria bacterium]
MRAHTLEPSILREYDIRGIVGETLGREDATAIGRAFGSRVIRAGGRQVCVGFDGRLSSPDLTAALVEGLLSTGCDVLRVGRGPTPMLYFAVHHLDADGGIMVTGSHNPPDYNGFKMMLGGAAFYGDDIQSIGTLTAAGDFETGSGSEAERPVLDDYVARVTGDYRGNGELKVAWDSGNGAMGEALAAAVRRLPGEHILLNEAIDGTFPNHHPDPTVAANLVQLQETVRAEGCDLGIAFDGDGDRIGAVDGGGEILWADQLLAVLAREVIEEAPGATIIADVKASEVLFDEIARLGGTPLMWKTGHSLIKAKMKETGAPLAGEMSGHIFFADRYYGFDDALYAAVRLLNVLSASGESLAQFRGRLSGAVNTPELRFPCSEDRKVAVVEEVRARLQAAGAELSDVDGVRVKTQDGWWLLRASNTQDVLVARCEARDQAGIDRLKRTLIAQLDQSGIEAPDF